MGATQSKTTQCILETSKGSLTGIEYWGRTNKPVCQRYTRVPYALPPTGELRWRRPQPLADDYSFNSDAGKPGNFTTFGPMSPQPIYSHNTVVLENKDAAPEPDAFQKEDCLYLNIWIPSGKPPKDGWAVQFFIHGGWLQVGNAMQSNAYDPFDLMSSTDTPRIIVSPTHRLNLFGFLASPALAELAEDPAPGNYGFWDQRAALEWTAANISHFGGNADNISVGGLSAGANSAEFQLYYDTYLPSSQRIIKRAYLYSNSIGIQPNSVASTTITAQFDELCTAFSIAATLSAAEKMSRLRAINSTDLIDIIPKLKFHTFRACTDSFFIPSNFLQSIHSGAFTTLLAQHGVSIVLGEVGDEQLLYRLVNPPSDLPGLQTQLQNYYPVSVVDALVKHYPLPASGAPASDWQNIYGQITADGQAHATVRGLAHILLHPPPGSTALPLSSVHRYRIKWRAQSLDAWLDPSVGVCHGADQCMWFCSAFRAGYTDEDKEITQKWLKPFNDFLAGRVVEWGTGSEREVRELDATGEIRVVEDEEWEGKMGVWDAMRTAQLE